jgi:hypothetical protein
MNGDLTRYRGGKLDTFHFDRPVDSPVAQVSVTADDSVLGATASGLVGWRNGKTRTLTVRNRRGRVQIRVRLIRFAEQGPGVERAEAIARLDGERGPAQQTVQHQQARELRRLETHLGIAEEESGLSRRLAPMAQHAARRIAHDIAAVELAILFRLQEI